jgi:hypothetical protein
VYFFGCIIQGVYFYGFAQCTYYFVEKASELGKRLDATRVLEEPDALFLSGPSMRQPKATSPLRTDRQVRDKNH